MRRYLSLMESDFPTELGAAYRGLENSGNPWGMSQTERADWAKDLANQLRTAGQPAEVWDPVAPEESYRVVVGPYQTREAADEAGKKLGRPYFLVVRPPSER